jgi:hypothetical protein
MSDIPRPSLTAGPPQSTAGNLPDAIRRQREAHNARVLGEIHAAGEQLKRWHEQFREIGVTTSDGDGYIIYGKDIREEPVGHCPFILRAKHYKGGGNTWKGMVAPGVVLFEAYDGQLTAIRPEYEGEAVGEGGPEFDIDIGESVWFVHVRDAAGVLTRIYIVVSAGSPTLSEGESVLQVAELKQDGIRIWVEQHIGGTYVLRPATVPGGSGSDSGSGDDSGSDSGSGDYSDDYSKSAIYPVQYPNGVEYVGVFATEQPQMKLEDVKTVSIDTGGVGLWLLDTEFVSGVKPETILVRSVLPDEPVPRCGKVTHIGEHVLVEIRCPGAIKANITVEGVFRWSPERFARFTEEQAASNAAFYRQAHDPTSLC